jgi:uncharacterized protein (DUF1015 family)
MAIIVPFRGVRYNPAVVPALDAVVTQPYDKISPAMQKAYYDESPYNFVRIILGMDDPNDDKYQRAATLFQDWIQKKVVRVPSNLYDTHRCEKNSSRDYRARENERNESPCP